MRADIPLNSYESLFENSSVGLAHHIWLYSHLIPNNWVEPETHKRKLMRELGSEHFIHLEMEAGLRKRLLGSASKREKFFTALHAAAQISSD